jgi:hypothetical protein
MAGRAGGGCPSVRGKVFTTLLVACAFALALGAAQAHAAPKAVVGHFGSTGTSAAQFSTPAGMAVRQSNGNLYVVDSGNNRIQQFDAAGNFVRAWGWDVKLPATVPPEVPVFEKCEATDFCKQGVSGGGAGQLAAAQGIAVNQTTGLEASGHVYVTNQGNRRVEEFDEDGDFVRAWGWDVAEPAAAPGAAMFEICNSGSLCRQGASGSGAGQFGTSMGNLAVDPRNGNILVADRSNRRVQRFDGSLGTFMGSFGGAGSGVGQFAITQPARVAVDSGGFVYTVESTSTRRVQKFNPAGTSAAVFAPDHTSGTSNATPPTDVAIDPFNDQVIVTKNTDSLEVLEFGIAGELVETHAAGAGLPAANGLAVDSSPDGRIYISTSPDQRVFVLGTPLAPPSATIAPTSAVTATGATFHGTVNPNGGGVLTTEYHFEYSDDAGVTWTRAPGSEEDVGSGTADKDATHVATGLEPNTQYGVRLVASRPFGGGSATSSADIFATLPAPPTLSGVAAREVTDTTAVLAGQIDANRSHTTYRFDYGTDTSYGSSTTVDSVGSGPADVPVSKAIAGLRPNTTYHFRLVATSAAGEAEGPDGTFTTDAGPSAGTRAYEMVSPLDKNGGHVERDSVEDLEGQSGASLSGDAVAFVSRSAFGDSESGSFFPTYIARRGAAGWTTRGISPPIDDLQVGVVTVNVFGFTPDLSKAFVKTNALLTPNAQMLSGSWGLYMRRLDDAPRYTLMSIPWQTLAAEQFESVRGGRFEYMAATPNGRHVVFGSSRQLLPSPAPPDRGSPLPKNAVYEWVDGTLRFASALPSELALNGAVGAGNGEVPTQGSLAGDHVISDDGRRVFFTAAVRDAPNGTARGSQIFVREDGVTTRPLSKSERPGEGYVPSTLRFWGARRTDGSAAFFTSTAPLAQGADHTTSSLYRWEATPTDGKHLTEITPAGSTPGVLGPVAISDDSRSVYFVATGVLADDATPDGRNLYLWRESDGVRHVATLAGVTAGVQLDAPIWSNSPRSGGLGARVSSDGERLLFASYADLDDGYATTEATPEACGDPTAGGDPCRQIYLYDARNDSTTCVTCVAGVAVTGDANLFGNSDPRVPGREISTPQEPPRNLSPDGTRVYFETTRPLVSTDRNAALDVYEWEDRDLDSEGELHLMSPGRSAHDAKFLDASASGDDVFFTTREQLVGIDTDNQIDLYDARVGGGIPGQNPTPAGPPCEGEQCQGTVTGAPSLGGIASNAVSNGDARLGPRPSFSVVRLSARQRARLARGLPVSVRVRVNRRGRVALTARAKLGRRTRTVDKSAKVARNAGRVRLGLRLSDAAQRELEQRGRLALKLVVKFAGVREARTSTVRLRRMRSSGERSSR